MSLIVPTLTAENENDFNSQLNLITGFSNRIHIDLMDGDFAPTLSPLPDNIIAPIFTKFDVHIMYKNPLQVVSTILRWHPRLIIIHTESNVSIEEFVNGLPINVKKGVALLPQTSVDSIKPYLGQIDHVLVFGGHLGYHGGVANLEMLEKVKQLRAINPTLEIAWDGGANMDNVMKLSEAGVDIINVGGAIHNTPNPRLAYIRLASRLNGKNSDAQV